MKAVINLDVPDYQIGQPVTVYFKDTMVKHGICEQNTVVRCKDCKYWTFAEWDGEWFCPYHVMHGKPDWFCADGERK